MQINERSLHFAFFGGTVQVYVALYPVLPLGRYIAKIF